MREAILRNYGRSAEKGSDLALLLEAELLGPNEYEDYEKIKTTSEMFHGVEVIGPFDAGELHMQGGGTYNLYKVYIDAADVGFPVPAGAYYTIDYFVPFSTLNRVLLCRLDCVLHGCDLHLHIRPLRLHLSQLRNDIGHWCLWVALH
jgi:hypothetical protein